MYAPHELAILREQIGTTRWISEIGLDGLIASQVGSFFGSQPSLEEQQRLLESVLGLGVGAKILSVHSRGAAGRVVDILAGAGARAAVFHWFRGSIAEARRAVDAGYLLSVNVAMLQSAEGRELIAWLPVAAMLFETDGPYTHADEGRPSEPRDVLAVCRDVAELRGADSDELLRITAEDFRRLEALADT